MAGKFFWFLIFILIGCSSGTKRLNTQLIGLYEEGKYQEALTILEKSDLKKDKKNKLFYEMSRGILLFSLKDYKDASLAFKAAQDIIDQQETISIRGKLSKELLKEQNDLFYGSLVEQSYAFYYSTLSFLLQEKKDGTTQDQPALMAARASILAWNFFFSKLQNDEMKTFYLRDLSQKMIGAKVHELVDTSEDRQISLALYKEARVILLSEYKESIEITGDKKKDLQHFIETKIFELTYRLRPGEIAGLKKEFKWELARPKNELTKFTFLLQEGIINKKSEKKVDLSLRAAFDSKATGAQAGLSVIGFAAMNVFAMSILKMPAGGSGVYVANQNGGFYGSANGLVALAAHEASLSFEIFEQKNKPSQQSYQIAFLKEDETPVVKTDLVIIGAVGEMAQKIADEDSAVRMVKAGTKFVIKHVVAMVGAYSIYQTFKAKDQAGIGQLFALGSYVGATKLIAWLGEADTRYIPYLPHNVLMSEINLEAGKYRVKLISKNDGTVISDLGLKEVKKNNEFEFFQLR